MAVQLGRKWRGCRNQTLKDAFSKKWGCYKIPQLGVESARTPIRGLERIIYDP